MNKTLGLCLLSVSACALIVGAATLREKTAAPDLEPLDTAMHARFEVPENFGMGRLFQRPEHATKPVLASAAARKASVELKSQGWNVNFYLGGRELLDPKVDVLAKPRLIPQQATDKMIRIQEPPQRALRGPVPVGIEAEKMPNPDQLQIAEKSRQALQSLMADKTKSEFRSQIGDWNLVAYPVNATQKECVSCHRGSKPSPQIGDTLGVTVYAYRRAL